MSDAHLVTAVKEATDAKLVRCPVSNLVYVRVFDVGTTPIILAVPVVSGRQVDLLSIPVEVSRAPAMIGGVVVGVMYVGDS